MKTIIIKFDDIFVGAYRGSEKNLENATNFFLFERNREMDEETCVQDHNRIWDEACERYSVRRLDDADFDLVADEYPLSF